MAPYLLEEQKDMFISSHTYTHKLYHWLIQFELSATNLLPAEHHQQTASYWVSRQFSETYGITSYASGSREDVVHYGGWLSSKIPYLKILISSTS